MNNVALDLFLADNKWISAARLPRPGADDGDGDGILIDLSPDGHDLLRDHGIHEFEQKIEAKLSSIGFQGSAWEIRSGLEEVWARFTVGLNQRFPRVLSRQGEGLNHRLLIDIEADLSCFRGHFPGNPILAGVTQLHWAACASCCLHGYSDLPAEVKRLKFKSMVSPPRVLELALARSRENEVQFEFSSLGQVHSQGSLVFDEGPLC